MERKASKPGVSRLNSDPGKPVVIPIEGKAKLDTLNVPFSERMGTSHIRFPPFSTEFPAPKNELFQRFHVYYLGSEPVAKPVGKKTPDEL